MNQNIAEGRRYGAVLFDLLTALLDSWSLWNSIAGDEETGLRWRSAYLKISYEAGAYRPYEDLVADAAAEVGVPRSLAHELDARFGELRPWPDVEPTLRKLKDQGIRLGIVTNCSERLGRIAAAQIAVDFDVFVSAERAGFYKQDPRPYLLALDEIEVHPARCLFVAGSSRDLIGTANVGLPVYWHDRLQQPVSSIEVPKPLMHEPTLAKLLPLVLGL